LGNLVDVTLDLGKRHKLAAVPDRERMCHAPCDGKAATITRKAIQLAKRGDLIALRLCPERIVPPRHERPVNFTLPEINSVDHATKAMAAITVAVAAAELTPAEAAELSRIVDGYVKMLEVTEIERRLQSFEERAARNAK